jgi:salicylate hydroxylase
MIIHWGGAAAASWAPPDCRRSSAFLGLFFLMHCAGGKIPSSFDFAGWLLRIWPDLIVFRPDAITEFRPVPPTLLPSECPDIHRRADLHIVIIGAGLGGLCLAQGLQRRGVSFDVYERDAAPDSRPQGFRIKIDQTGQQALEACLPPALNTLFRETCAIPVNGVNLIGPGLEPVSERWVASWQRAGGDDAPVGRVEDVNADRLAMRRVLLSGIEAHVHFGRAFAGCERSSSSSSSSSSSNGGALRARFEDGSVVEGDVLVAADGVNSAVRAMRLPDVVPLDTGSTCIYGKTLFAADTASRIAPLFHAKTSVAFGDRLAVIVDPMRFRPRASPAPVGDYLYWAMIGPNDRLNPDDDDAAALLSSAPRHRAHAIVLSRAADWHPGFRSLFELAAPSDVAMLPVRTMTAPPTWQTDGVTVIGDAIHVMSPAGGLGANTALHDAATLAQKLGDALVNRTSVLAAVAAYEAAMRDYAREAIQQSNDGAKLLFGAVAA